MTEFDPEHIWDEEEIDDTIPHPSPDELGLLSIDDPGFIAELDRRAADNSPGIPWSEIRREPL
jgi:hypothetical protein